MSETVGRSREYINEFLENCGFGLEFRVFDGDGAAFDDYVYENSTFLELCL
jgi:hypothetical protein